MTSQKLTKWGNSLGIRLPQEMIKQLEWQEGVNVTLSIKDNCVILSTTKPKYQLEDLLKNCQPEQQHDEIDWGESQGEET